ncbi:hypothetical protein MBANPS3_001109 [Mucor bainieri]
MKRLNGVRIVIKREPSRAGSLKSEIASPQQEYKPAKGELGESIALNTIKQEEIKDETLNKLKLKHALDPDDYTETRTRGNSRGIHIKQEDALKSEALVDIKKRDNKGYCYHCRICKKTFGNHQSVMSHRESVHNIKSNRPSIIKHMDLEPDINDPNYFCQGCEITYSSRETYRKHFAQTHHMLLKKKREPFNDVIPDPHDPNFYCKICDITHKNKQSYRSHCYKIHKMRIIMSDATAKMPHPNYECNICQKSFSSKISLNRHLFVIHKMDSDSANQPSNTKPDVNDPNNYCIVCDKTYSTKIYLKYHVRAAHSIRNKYQESDETKPDINDPNNYCRACHRKYISKYVYRVHLRNIHQMKFSRATAYDPNRFPDPFNPNWYCCVCKIYYKGRPSYRISTYTTQTITVQNVIESRRAE